MTLSGGVTLGMKSQFEPQQVLEGSCVKLVAEVGHANGNEETERWIYLIYTLEVESTGLARGLAVREG